MKKESNPRPEEVGAVKPPPPPGPPPIIYAKKLTVEKASRLKEAYKATFAGPHPGRIKIIKEGFLVTRKVGFWERVKNLFCGCTRNDVIE